MVLSDAYSIRVEKVADGGIETTSRCLYWHNREVALFSDSECDERDAKQVLEAVTRYWALLNAVKDLVFLVGQMPAAATINDQELNRAYITAADFLREEHERCVENS